MNGEGILRMIDGTKFKGTFRNGEKNGFGIMEDKEGVRFEGYFENNERHGEFVLKDKNGHITQKGTYNHGVIENKE